MFKTFKITLEILGMEHYFEVGAEIKNLNRDGEFDGVEIREACETSWKGEHRGWLPLEDMPTHVAAWKAEVLSELDDAETMRALLVEAETF